MKSNPLVSIVIPVYKGANYLAEAINSALAQTYKNIEIVVVNDGSPDDGATEKVALSYGNKINYVFQKNGGVSSALNTGLREMKGDYFSWLSHDDLYEPMKIEKQIALIQSENDIILCSGSLVDENRRSIPHHIKILNGRFDTLHVFDAFLHNYSLNGLGFLIPRHIFERIGGFDESMRYLQDLDMWLRILMHDEYTFVCQKDLLVITRIHRGQQTNTISDVFDVDRRKLAVKHFKIIGNDDSIRNKKLLYELYYKLFVKGANKPGIEEATKVLLKNGYTEFQLKKMALPFYVKGRVKSIFRSFYITILRLKGERN